MQAVCAHREYVLLCGEVCTPCLCLVCACVCVEWCVCVHAVSVCGVCVCVWGGGVQAVVFACV